MKITLQVVSDVEVPAAQLLNSQDFQVLGTDEKNTFTLIKKSKEDKLDEQTWTGTMPSTNGTMPKYTGSSN